MTLTVRIGPVTLGQSSHQGCCQNFSKMSSVSKTTKHATSSPFTLCWMDLKRSLRTFVIMHILSIIFGYFMMTQSHWSKGFLKVLLTHLVWICVPSIKECKENQFQWQTIKATFLQNNKPFNSNVYINQTIYDFSLSQFLVVKLYCIVLCFCQNWL